MREFCLIFCIGINIIVGFKIEDVEFEKREKMGLLAVKVGREINEKRVTRETLVLSSFGDPQKSDTLDLASILGEAE